METGSQIALQFEFGIVGDELELSGDESLLSQVAAQASKAEIKAMQEANFVLWRGNKADQFQNFFEELLRELQPTDDDHLARMNVVARLASAVDELSGATLSPFGSFESNLYTRWADMDLSLVLPYRTSLLQPISKKVKGRILSALSRTLTRKGEARKVQFIPYARVPLITFEDSQTNISCDISVDNDTAVVKSRMLRWLCEVDSRCRDLIFLVKFWAKAHDINDPKLGTLNSFALCLLVIFHLQTRTPPVLPPLSSVLDEDVAKRLKGCENLTEEVSKSCWEKIQPYIGNKFGAQNKTTVTELFATFINQFSAIKELWSLGLAVCTFTGAWGDRSSTCGKWRSKRYMMAIEDPFDRSENCARSVQHTTFGSIVKAFTSTAEAISRAPMDIGMPSMLESLFLWSAEKQVLGLQAWLSKVLSKDEKLKQGQWSVSTVHAAQYRERPKFNKSKEVSLNILVNNAIRDQFKNQLQVNDSGSLVPTKKKKRKKRFSNGGPPAIIAGAGLGVNSPESEKNSHSLKKGAVKYNKTKATRKPAVTREGITGAVVDPRVAAEDQPGVGLRVKSPGVDLREQVSHSFKKGVVKTNKAKATRKRTVPVEGILAAVVDPQAAAEDSSQTELYGKTDHFSVRKSTRSTAESNIVAEKAWSLVEGSWAQDSTIHHVPPNSIYVENPHVAHFNEASPAIQRSSNDNVAMWSTESSSLSTPQVHRTFVEIKNYASASKNTNAHGSKFWKGTAPEPELGHNFIDNATMWSTESSSLTIPQVHRTFVETKNYASSSKNTNAHGSKFWKGTAPELELGHNFVDNVVMRSTESSSLTTPQVHRTFVETKNYASASKNANAYGRKFCKGTAPEPELGHNFLGKNAGAIERSAITGASLRMPQGDKRFLRGQVYPHAAQVWMPRKMDDKFTKFSSASEGQRKTIVKYGDDEPLLNFEKAEV